MSSMTAEKEYKVLVTHFPLGEVVEQQGRWRATLLGFTYIVEKATSRKEVINQIKARINEILRNSEIITKLVDEIGEERDRHLVGNE